MSPRAATRKAQTKKSGKYTCPHYRKKEGKSQNENTSYKDRTSWLLSAAAAETLDEEIAQNIKEKVGEKEFMSVVGRISIKVIQHVTGKEKMNSEIVKFCIRESALLFPEEQEIS